jgi:hypothetical protein
MRDTLIKIPWFKKPVRAEKVVAALVLVLMLCGFCTVVTVGGWWYPVLGLLAAATITAGILAAIGLIGWACHTLFGSDYLER